jgi:cytochrome c-type biogenesis protein CcmH
MLLWVTLAVMTAIAALAVLAPLARARRAAAAAGQDQSVYRDQLAELDRDLARGLIAPAEAEAARTEIARRLLRAAREAEAEDAAPQASSFAAGAASMVAILVIPAIALGLYLRIGHPDLPDQPLAARLAEAPDTQSIDALIARAEAHLARKPDDALGWDVMGALYLRLNRASDAVTAYRNAIQAGGGNASRQTGLGQALTMQSGGVVTKEARTAFESALGEDPKAVAPKMFLALALSQEGRKAESVAAWKRLIRSARGDEPWFEAARKELQRVDPRETAEAGGADVAATAPAAGPSQDDIAAAQKLPAVEQSRMIESMVARLSERLETSGGSIDDWSRLIRSLAVLGRKEEALAALQKAHEAFKDNDQERAKIDELARGLGLIS